MALPTSGPISMSQVLAELQSANSGRTTPIGLGDSDVRSLAGVGSGAISMANLLGKSSLAVNIAAHTLTNINTGASSCSVTFTVQNNGSLTWSKSGPSSSGSYASEWLNQTVDSSTASLYEVRVTVSSGVNPSSGTLGTWLNCGTSRVWQLNVAANGGLRQSVVLVEIRLASSGVVQDSANITMHVESSNM